MRMFNNPLEDDRPRPLPFSLAWRDLARPDCCLAWPGQAWPGLGLGLGLGVSLGVPDTRTHVLVGVLGAPGAHPAFENT